MAACRIDILFSSLSQVSHTEAFESAKGGVLHVQVPKSHLVSLRSHTSRKKWSSALARVVPDSDFVRRTDAQIAAKFHRVRCNVSPEGGDDVPSKSYDVNEVVETVVHEEEGKLPEAAKTPEPLPEGEPSPFSPAIDEDTDDSLHANQGAGVSKETLVEPPRGFDHTSSAASSSTGSGGEQSRKLSEAEHIALHDVGETVGSSKSGGRDWRVHSHGENGGSIGESGEGVAVNVSLQSIDERDAGKSIQKNQMYGWSESACDDGSFLLLAGILQEDGGKSIDDYRTRADIFGKSAEFIVALKSRTHSAV